MCYYKIHQVPDTIGYKIVRKVGLEYFSLYVPRKLSTARHIKARPVIPRGLILNSNNFWVHHINGNLYEEMWSREFGIDAGAPSQEGSLDIFHYFYFAEDATSVLDLLIDRMKLSKRDFRLVKVSGRNCWETESALCLGKALGAEYLRILEEVQCNQEL